MNLVSKAEFIKTHQPPYDLTANFLFVMALAATPSLRRSFPGVPFLSVFGKTPLILWFSRITQACYFGPNDQRQCEHDSGQIPYTELNIVALLNKKAFFVPRIYASSQLSVQVASLYAMPKILHPLLWRESSGVIESNLMKEGHKSFVRARVFQGGSIIAKWLAPFLPLTVWPALFPAESNIRAIIQTIPAVQPAWVQQGHLSLPEPWLPKSTSFFSIGLYLPQLTMRLPPP